MAVGVAAFAWLHRFPGDPPLMGSDGSIWFDLARNCVELGRCPTFGAPSSMHLDTGHAWIDLQMLVQLAHGSSLAERAVVFALLAAGVGTLTRVLWRWVGAVVALPAALAMVTVLRRCEDPGRLWNPSPVFAPSALATAALLVFAWTDRVAALWLGTALLSVALNLHLAALALVPAVAALAVLARPRPVVAAAQVLALGFAMGLVTALSSTVRDLQAVPSLAHALVFVAAAVATLGVAFAARGPYRTAGPEVRGLAVLGTMLAPWLGGVRMLATHMGPQDHFWDLGLLTSTYGLPAIAAASVFVTLAPAHLAGRLAARAALGPRSTVVLRGAAALLGYAAMRVVAAHTAVVPYAFGLPREDVHAVTRHLESRGWDYERLAGHLQNQRCQSFLAGVVTYAAMPFAAPPDHDPLDQARVWILPAALLPAALPGSFQRVPLRHGRVAAVSTIRSWFDFGNIAYCEQRAGAFACSSLPERHDGDPFTGPSFTHRGGLWYPPSTRTGAPVEAVAMPLVSSDGVREISVTSEGGCPWTLDHVDGLPSEPGSVRGTLRVTGRPGTAGRLWVTRNAAQCMGWDPMPPCLAEHLPDDPSTLREDHLRPRAIGAVGLPPRAAGCSR